LAVLLLVLAGQAAAQAVFVEVQGKVEVLPSGAAEWTAAAEGMIIEANTVISTGFKSNALIQTGSSQILLRPITRLTLEEIVVLEKSEEISLSLRAGRIRADVSPPTGSGTVFTVRSPMTVASVRGTSFEFDTVNLVVANGLVRYSYVNGLTVYVAGLEASHTEDEARRVVPPQELALANRIPRIPLYTGLEEIPPTPRYLGSSPPDNNSSPAGPPLGPPDPPITPPVTPPITPPGFPGTPPSTPPSSTPPPGNGTLTPVPNWIP
jgi:hypothetical protein